MHRELLAELDELVENLCHSIDELRFTTPASYAASDLLDQVFRYVHSIKGISAAAGLDHWTTLAHETEGLLDAARADRITLTPEVLDALEDVADALANNPGRGNTSAAVDLLRERLRDLASRAADAALKTAPLPDLPAGLGESLSDREKAKLVANLARGAGVFSITANFPRDSFESEFQQLRQILARMGQILTTTPSHDPRRPGAITFGVVFATVAEPAELKRSLTAFGNLEIEELRRPDEPARKQPVIASQTMVDNRAQPPAAAAFVRVELDELDRLIAASHEVFRETAAALAWATTQLAPDSRHTLQDLDARLRESLTSLEEQIIQLRMVPVGRIVQRALRAGRVAGRIAGKEIAFSSSGTDILIDKSLCDAAADPLVHLVRNAVDHGIELPEERIAAGKDRVGKVRVEITADEGGATFLVGDDGRGIDSAAVTRTAVKIGLIKSDAQLSIDDSLRLIFRPGFSTASEVSTISGRGVGLDVVESAVEQRGGAVRLRTEPGLGSEFLIHLPATFGVLRSVVIRSGAHHYCVDAKQVLDHFTIDVKELAGRLNTQLVPWRNSHLPVAHLAHLLHNGADDESSAGTEAVVFHMPAAPETAASAASIALLVDKIEGTEEVLVRGLGSHAARWQGVTGAAELRNGELALVLDMRSLLNLRSADG